MNDDLIGVRPEDLDPDQRARQEALLRTSVAAREAHEEALRTGEVIRSFEPPPSALTADAILRRAAARLPPEADSPPVAAGVPPAMAAVAPPVAVGVSPAVGANRGWWLAGAVGLLAAAGALLVALPDGVRDRGGVAGGREVHLEAVAEGPTGLRALRDGARVGPDERVIFRVETRGEGWLRLEEVGSATVWPPSGASWQVGAGQHVPGGDDVASYRPDQGGGTLAYRVWYCGSADPGTSGSECAVDGLSLLWE